MNWKISCSIILVLLLTACRDKEGKLGHAADPDSSPFLMDVAELKNDLGNTGIKIIDFRKEDEYNQGHIPGALNIWRTDLHNPDYAYKGMLVRKSDLEALLGRLGIDDEDLLVIYDDKGSVDACRLWWTLQYYSFDSVRILNGGLSAWRESGGDVSQEEVQPIPTQFQLPDSTHAEILITKEELQDVQGDYNLKILDVRSSDEYSGRLQRPGASRAGRIPGSIHVEWSMAIDSNKKFKSTEDLAQMYSKLGLNSSDSIAVYCHSGSRSAHTTFVLGKLLKYKTVMNYDGSWTEWSFYEELPIEKDSIILEDIEL